MIFLRLLRSVKTELVNVIKDRDIIILLLAGPFFLTLLFGGVYFNPYIDDIPVAVLDEDNSNMSRMIVQQFDENDRFRVDYYTSDRRELENLINTKKAILALYIPDGFYRDFSSLRTTEVMIMVDGSNMVTGNSCYAAASGIVQTISAGAVVKLLELKGFPEKTAQNIGIGFNMAERTLYDPKMSYMNYILMGFLAVFLQQVMLSGVGISVVKNGKKIASERTIYRLSVRIAACSVYALISVFASIWVSHFLFRIPMRGNLLLVLLFCIVFIAAICCPAIIIAALLRDKLKFTQVAYMLSLPTFASCGYVWPQDQMPQWLVWGIKAFWPLMSFARPFDELLVKGIALSEITWNFIDMIIYTAVWLPFAVWFLKIRFKTIPDNKNLQGIET